MENAIARHSIQKVYAGENERSEAGRFEKRRGGE